MSLEKNCVYFSTPWSSITGYSHWLSLSFFTPSQRVNSATRPTLRGWLLTPRAKSETKMADRKAREVVISTSSSAKLLRWRVSVGTVVREGSVLCFYEVVGEAERPGSFITQPKLKSAFAGKVRELLVSEGEIVAARYVQYSKAANKQALKCKLVYLGV